MHLYQPIKMGMMFMTLGNASK
nr:unnamed protein product [Callosobruchus chinensis]